MFTSDTGWTVTEERKRPARKTVPRVSSAPNLLQSSSVLPGRITGAHSNKSTFREGVANVKSCNGAANVKSCNGDVFRGGYAEWQARFVADFNQQLKCGDMAVPRRRRLVEETLQTVRDCFDPTDGLEAAAAAAADEIQWRTQNEQFLSCATLAQPRSLPLLAEAKPAGPTRSWVEQQARCEELSKLPSRPSTPMTNTAQLPTRSATAQQKRCVELAQPRLLAEVPSKDEPPVLAVPWREHLAARASALVPEEVQAAQALLAQMREKAANNSGNSSAPDSLSQLRSSFVQPARHGHVQPRPTNTDVAAPLAELRAVVEEVLWVALLQIRSCPKAPVVGHGNNSNAGVDGRNSALDDRLANLLVSNTGPALRPVARRVLGPGTALARRVRNEFPRLAMHLGFRESEDTEPPAVTWSCDEITQYISEVKTCRDRLLAMDFTKTIIAAVGH